MDYKGENIKELIRLADAWGIVDEKELMYTLGLLKKDYIALATEGEIKHKTASNLNYKFGAKFVSKKMAECDFFLDSWSYQCDIGGTELERLLGVWQPSLFRWRNKKCKPQLKVILRISECFGVEVDVIKECIELYHKGLEMPKIYIKKENISKIRREIGLTGLDVVHIEELETEGNPEKKKSSGKKGYREKVDKVYNLATEALERLSLHNKENKEYYLIPTDKYEPHPYVLTAKEIAEDIGMSVDDLNSFLGTNFAWKYKGKYELVAVNDIAGEEELYCFYTRYRNQDLFATKLKTIGDRIQCGKPELVEKLLSGSIKIALVEKDGHCKRFVEELNWEYSINKS